MSTIRNLAMAWVLTLPVAILLSGSLYWLFSPPVLNRIDSIKDSTVDLNDQELIRRIHRDLADSYDEELELEDHSTPHLLSKQIQQSSRTDAEKESRRNCIFASCSACRPSWSSCRIGWSIPDIKSSFCSKDAMPPGKGGAHQAHHLAAPESAG